MKRSTITRAMLSVYYVPTIILVLFLLYVAALIFIYNRAPQLQAPASDKRSNYPSSTLNP